LSSGSYFTESAVTPAFDRTRTLSDTVSRYTSFGRSGFGPSGCVGRGAGLVGSAVVRAEVEDATASDGRGDSPTPDTDAV
jgi:hypothetical protein